MKPFANDSIEAQIAEVRRELAMRERVYPSWVVRGTMKREDADRQTARMQAVLATLVELQKKGNLL